MYAANKKWQIASSLQQSTAPVDPTPTEVNVSKFISAQDLKSLKERDPFLYYSIPEVREATIRLEDDDLDMHQVALNGMKRYSNSKSCPTSIQSSRASEAVIKVKRCKRHSFECHTDLLLEDLGLEELYEGSNLGEKMDDFLSELFPKSKGSL